MHTGSLRNDSSLRVIFTTLLALIVALTIVPDRSVAQDIPDVDVDPDVVNPGDTTTVSGVALRGCGVEIVLQPTGTSLGSAELTDGNFSVEVEIPASTEPGTYEVVVTEVIAEKSGQCSVVSDTSHTASLVVRGDQIVYDYDIALQSRLLDDPETDQEFEDFLAGDQGVIHGLIQLDRLPTDAEVEALSGAGIELLSYLNGLSGRGTTYVAAFHTPINWTDITLKRGVFSFLPDDKLAWVFHPPDPILEAFPGPTDVGIRFFDDVEPEDARALFAELEIPASNEGGIWNATIDGEQLDALLSSDIVQFVEPQLIPDLIELDDNRATQNVDAVHQLDTTTGIYSGLSGDGVDVAIMDTGVDTAHDDYTGRIIRVKDDTGQHGSHVAGIASGNGFMSDKLDGNGDANGGTPFQWRGMAPESDIAAYNSQVGGNGGTMQDAIVTNGVDVSNHSYAVDPSGTYSSANANIDTIIRGDNPNVPARPQTYSAGNGGTSSQYGTNAGFFALTKACKNCIMVANATSGSVHSAGSSLGPTIDGRLKPDLSAVGSGVVSVDADTDDGIDDGYRTSGGTSMASPNISGIIALMLEQYADTFGVNIDTAAPLPSTSRAILVQTAVDLVGTDSATNPDTGTANTYGPGPDWATGYGMVDALAATQMVADEQFLEDSVDGGDLTDTYWVAGTAGDELKVTLSWDDLAGTPNANHATPALVNNLDLTLIDPDGVVHQPLILPAVTPNDCDGNAGNGIQVGTCPGIDSATQDYVGPAAEGDDSLNNTEQVVIADPEPGNWQVRVTALNEDGVTVELPMGGTQSYSLAGVTQNDPPTADADGPYATVEGTDVTLDGSGSTDPEGEALIYEWDFEDDGDIDATGVNPTFDVVGQDGVIPVRLIVTDPGGLIDEDTTSVTVDNVAPTVDFTLNGPIDEGDSVTLTGSVTDPGWLDPLTATIDWGDGLPAENVSGTLENNRPDATLTFEVTHPYGDNGVFTVEVCGSDDDTTVCVDDSLVVNNVDPTIDLDESTATLFPGGPAFTGKAGNPQTHEATGEDVGSDDLTFDWSFGETTTYFNDGLNPDPFPSPLGTYPFAVTDTGEVTFPLPGAYLIGIGVTDDDGGTSGDDELDKVVVGNADDARSKGWWKHQYSGQGNIDLDAATLQAYLDIIEVTSSVFEEQTSLADAHAVLSAQGNDKREQATAELLVAWLHYASGAVEWDADIPIGGGSTMAYSDIMFAAEGVISDLGSSNKDLTDTMKLLRATVHGD